MGRKSERVRLALDGTIAQRNLNSDEARQFDASIAVRVDEAVARADFASAPLPDFAAVSPYPHGVLVDLASRAQLAAHTRDRLREALTRLEQVLGEQPPAEAGR